MEHKLIQLPEVKFASDEAKTNTFSGYGSVFNNIDAYGDTIIPGAYKDTLRSGFVPLMFLNHDMRSLPIGKWTSLVEDDFGLKIEGEFLDTSTGRDVYAASKAQAITGLSIGFRPLEVEMHPNAKAGEPLRTIKSIDLLEISVVTFPANDDARIADVKSFRGVRDYAVELMHLGMSANEAKAFIDALEAQCQTKYKEAEFHAAARNLLKTLKGEK